MFFIFYLRWHYVDILKELVVAWGNFLWFGMHYFSVPVLLKTFFSYWKQLHRPYLARGFDMQESLKVLGENIFSRVIGATVRLVVLVVAFTVEIFIFGAGIVGITIWSFLPFLIVWGLLYPFI